MISVITADDWSGAGLMSQIARRESIRIQNNQ
jgi:hypothetical protein